MLYVVDTHALVWFLTQDARLGFNAQTVLSSPGPGNRLVVPTIVLAETWDLARKLRVPVSFRYVLGQVRSSNALIHSLSVRVLTLLPNGLPDIHDAIVVATAVALGSRRHPAAIVTRDRDISNSGLAPCIW